MKTLLTISAGIGITLLVLTQDISNISELTASLNDAMISAPLTAAIVSSLLAATAMNLFTYYKERIIRTTARKKERSDLAKAILAELDAILTIYKTQKLTEHIPENQNETAISHLGQEYLIVYKQNASKLGLFRQSDAKAIIELYVNIMGLMDSLVYLSDCLDQREKYRQIESNLNVIDPKQRVLLDQYIKNAHDAAYKYQGIILDKYPVVKKILEWY